MSTATGPTNLVQPTRAEFKALGYNQWMICPTEDGRRAWSRLYKDKVFGHHVVYWGPYV